MLLLLSVSAAAAAVVGTVTVWMYGLRRYDESSECSTARQYRVAGGSLPRTPRGHRWGAPTSLPLADITKQYIKKTGGLGWVEWL